VNPDAMMTFAIPYYNRPDLLQKCLNSLLAQTSSDWQSILCDDSSDRSAEPIVLSLKDSRIQYLANEQNLGMAKNWNRCLSLVQTPYVTLLHADDELLPNYARLMPDLLDQHPEASAVFCEARIIDEHSQECFSFPDWVKGFLRPSGLAKIHGEVGLQALLRGNFIMCPTVCYRRSSLPEVGFDPQWRFVLDLDLFGRILLNNGTLIGTPEKAYAYRRHGGNATSEYTRTLLRFREEAAIYDKIGMLAKAAGWNSAARTAQRKAIIRLHLAYHTLADVITFRWGNLTQKCKLAWNL
jgi:glycosyltransferase involved in cell wall biosynthesis